MTPEIFGVPASKQKGLSLYSVGSAQASTTMPPPKTTGLSVSSNVCFPKSMPVPVGPYILCPEKATRSASHSATSIWEMADHLRGIDDDDCLRVLIADVFE
jgi:hypothetical protein